MDIDVIGQLVDPAQTDEEGAEIAPAVVHDGWHVNITKDGLAARPDLAEFVVTPGRLRRVWAGDDCETPTMTVALRFEDQTQADQELTPAGSEMDEPL